MNLDESASAAAAPPAEAASQTPGVRLGFDNTYARLPQRFHARLAPTPVAAPRLIRLNVQVARDLGLDPAVLASAAGVLILAGNRVAADSEPLAQAYAGHQFGSFVPQLGDGRANLLGEVVGRDGLRYDIQLKGSGRTPFSRAGDGRAALGPVLREYIVSEAMAAMGVPTTRALAAVSAGEYVQRETPQPGAVLARVARSHLRVGTFQFFAARQDFDGVLELAKYAIARHDPEAATAAKPYRAFLDGVIARQAALIAQWLLIGFIHGVMNTDNMAISGETIDYGPCAFMEAYDPATVFSSIDHYGRYAYGNQPRIALWNLTRFAETLLPLLELEAGDQKAAVASATEALEAFAPQLEAAHLAGLRRKLGLLTEQESDRALAEDLLQRMAANHADFTLTFRQLCNAAAGVEGDRPVSELFDDPVAFDAWAGKWRSRLRGEPSVSAEERAASMRKVNPIYIPRNHRVEAALKAAVESGNFAPFDELLEALSRPFDERPGFEGYAQPARPEERVLQTFCGT
jgi:uncharacterized protein YdiU (UPF0061 family)